MLAELRERDATGEVAAIYDEIRRFWAVPYVSSLQRHLATRPGWLEWTWAALPPMEQAVLASLGTKVGEEPFVPGLYRMLASWPGFLAHVATVLSPHLHDSVTRAACRRLLEAMDAEVPAVFAVLPPPPTTIPIPSSGEFADVLAALDSYRETSPQMVIFGRMIGESLPAAQGSEPAVSA
jgi:hypothetical protein